MTRQIIYSCNSLTGTNTSKMCYTNDRPRNHNELGFDVSTATCLLVCYAVCHFGFVLTFRGIKFLHLQVKNQSILTRISGICGDGILNPCISPCSLFTTILSHLTTCYIIRSQVGLLCIHGWQQKDFHSTCWVSSLDSKRREILIYLKLHYYFQNLTHAILIKTFASDVCSSMYFFRISWRKLSSTWKRIKKWALYMNSSQTAGKDERKNINFISFPK
jgi:hypothetical protein